MPKRKFHRKSRKRSKKGGRRISSLKQFIKDLGESDEFQYECVQLKKSIDNYNHDPKKSRLVTMNLLSKCRKLDKYIKKSRKH